MITSLQQSSSLKIFLLFLVVTIVGANIRKGCVCGDGKKVNNPEASSVLYPGQKPMLCSDIERLCCDDTISIDDDCQGLINDEAFVKSCGCVVDEELALDDIQHECNGTDWYEGKENHYCDWTNVDCDTQGRISKLNLTSQSMKCEFSKTAFFRLTHLKELILDRNEMMGVLPNEVANLSHLKHLSFSDNQLSGTMPSKIASLTQLEILDLELNAISGSIPTEIGMLSKLETFNLDENLMSGVLPNEIGGLTQLKLLKIDDNSFTGTIPSEIWKLTTLIYLDLDDNLLRGELSTEIGNLTGLTILDLNGNEFTGTIPSEIGALTNLEELELGENLFTGAIPAECSALTSLKYLNFDHNGLNGTIPSGLLSLSQMKVLSLYDNKLSGLIPSEIGLLKNMTLLFFQHNQLHGTIPTEIGKMTHLKRLQLNGNSVFGAIPTELGALALLEILDLFDNQLRSFIPTEVGLLTHLQQLRLNNNSLFGAIPANLGENITILDLRNNTLRGPIPSGIGLLKNLKELYLQDNRLDSNIPTELGFNVNILHMNFTNNALKGSIPTALGQMQSLSTLNLSHNMLGGKIPTQLRELNTIRSLLLNNNMLTGSMPEELFNFSHVIQTLDLSSNKLEIKLHPKSAFWTGITNINKLILSDNKIEGQLTIPEGVSVSQTLRELHLGGNCFTGTLPAPLFLFAPWLEQLDLSSSKDCFKCVKKEDCNDDISQPGNLCCEGTRFCFENSMNEECISSDKFGINGRIPVTFSRFEDLTVLNLTGNLLSGPIPSAFGYGQSLPRLQILDLSNNIFTGEIPADLGNIGSEVSDNMAIVLKGNKFNDKSLAPLNLCQNPNFDDSSNETICPTEREILCDFFESAFGEEWVKNENWDDNYIHPCGNNENNTNRWYGVTCSDMLVKKVNLSSNGLGGTISGRIAQLSSLEILSLRDNDLKGQIPSNLTTLRNLRELDLSHNSLRGDITSIFTKQRTANLEMLRLQSNRLEGTIAGLVKPELANTESLFVSDCGFPSERGVPIKCENCTMCCNYFDECEITNSEYSYFDALSRVMKDDVFARFALITLMTLCGCALVSTASFCIRKLKGNGCRSIDNIFIWIGENSVYKYFLADTDETHLGWIASLLIVISQLFILYLFYREANLDFDREFYYDQTWDYDWACPPDQEHCRNIQPFTSTSWVVFAVMMIVNLGADFVNGCKLLYAAGTISNRGCRVFVGGSVLILTSVMGVYTSLVFNYADAESSTELIINSAVLLFVNHLDEMCLILIRALFPRWFKKMEGNIKNGQERKSRMSNLEDFEMEMQSKILALERDNERMRNNISIPESKQTKEIDMDEHMHGALSSSSEENKAESGAMAEQNQQITNELSIRKEENTTRSTQAKKSNAETENSEMKKAFSCTETKNEKENSSSLKEVNSTLSASREGNERGLSTYESELRKENDMMKVKLSSCEVEIRDMQEKLSKFEAEINGLKNIKNELLLIKALIQSEN